MAGRRLVLLTIALVAGACAEADTKFGDPNGIIGKTLPKESPSTPGGEFTGAFAPGKPATSLRAAHGTDPARPGPDKNVGDCLVCHSDKGAAAAKAFDFGGRLASKAGGAEVMVISGGQKLGPVKADDDGFFWSPRTTGVKADSRAFERNAKASIKMNDALPATGGGCDSVSCHGTQEGPSGKGLQ